MKKVIYILTILLAVALLSTSCEKDDPIVSDTDDITASDLDGMWTFHSLLYGGTSYVLGSQELADLNKDYDYVEFDLNFINQSEVNLHMDYTGSTAQNNLKTNANWGYYESYDEYLQFQLVDDVIKIPYIDLELQIMNVDSFDGTPLTTLELKMLDCNYNTAPINGVFILVK